MFLEADRVVKGVIIGLIFASIVTWTIGLAKSVEVGMGKRRLRESLEELGQVHTLEEGMDRLHDAGGIESVYGQAVERELHFSGASSAEKAGIQERIASRLGRIESAAGRRIARGTGMLATIGATAPFVGLFGTVWGIMNSFIGISEAQTTNLAVVAPGIAEALLVTAMGLITAIPAVVMYNFFARSIAGYRALLADISSEVLQLVSRDLTPQPLMSAVPAERQRWLRNVGE
jgi:biopolymer transport protein ExbB